MATKDYRFSDSYITNNGSVITYNKTNIDGESIPFGYKIPIQYLLHTQVILKGTKKYLTSDAVLSGPVIEWYLYDEAERNKKVLEQNRKVLKKLISELFIQNIPPFFTLEESDEDSDNSDK